MNDIKQEEMLEKIAQQLKQVSRIISDSMKGTNDTLLCSYLMFSFPNLLVKSMHCETEEDFIKVINIFIETYHKGIKIVDKVLKQETISKNN